MTAPAENARIFGSAAASYAHGRPRYPAALFDWLMLQVPSRTLAWDIGCGSGQATTGLAACFERVIANDVGTAQLAEAPSLANVQWLAAAAEAVVLAPASLDLALAANSVHWLDLTVFYPRLQQALVPGGVFACVAIGPTEVTDVPKAAFREAFAPLQPYWSEGNRRVWRGYADLPFPFQHILAPEFEIEADWTLDKYLTMPGRGRLRFYMSALRESIRLPPRAAPSRPLGVRARGKFACRSP